MTTRHGARSAFTLLSVGLTLAGPSLADQGPDALIDAIDAPFLTGKTAQTRVTRRGLGLCHFSHRLDRRSVKVPGVGRVSAA